MRMARVNVYLPDDLAAEVKAAGMNVSKITQEALRDALAGARTDAWLAEVAKDRPTGVTHEQVMTALREAREELWGDDA